MTTLKFWSQWSKLCLTREEFIRVTEQVLMTPVLCWKGAGAMQLLRFWGLEWWFGGQGHGPLLPRTQTWLPAPMSGSAQLLVTPAPRVFNISGLCEHLRSRAHTLHTIKDKIRRKRLRLFSEASVWGMLVEMLQKAPGTVVCMRVISYFRINQVNYIYAYLYTCIKQTYIHYFFKNLKIKKKKLKMYSSYVMHMGNLPMCMSVVCFWDRNLCIPG